MRKFLDLKEVEWDDFGGYDEELGKTSYRNGVELLHNQSISVVGMSDELRDRFGAVEVAASMLGETPSHRLYRVPSFGIYKGTKPQVVPLSYFNFNIMVDEVSLFIWRVESRGITNYLLLHLEDDDRLKYPIEMVKIDLNRDEKLEELLIEDEEELISWLEGLMYSM